MAKNARKLICLLCSLALSFALLPVLPAYAADSAATDSSGIQSTVATDFASTQSDSGDEQSADASQPLSVQAAEEATGIDADQEGTAYAEGEVLVTFKDGTTQAEATNVVQDAETVSTDQITDDALVASSIDDGTLEADTGGEAIAKVDVADDATVAQAVAELETDPSVASAQPNYIYYVQDDTDYAAADAAQSLIAQSTTINDPSASSQWQLNACSGSSYGVGCYQAWDYVKCSGSVAVAVIDTGCLVTHEDFAANIEGAYNSVSKTFGVDAVADSLGHGTHVCGIIGAVTNNGTGVSGVSYNAKIVPIKTVSDNGYFYTDGLVEAYAYLLRTASSDINGDGTIGTYAQEYNVRVINMSLGGEGECSSDDSFLQMIDEAYAANILTVCAAGNSFSYTDSSGKTVSVSVPYNAYPGDYATCVGVINLTSSGTRSSSSNYNSTGTSASPSTAKNISAPGTSIYSTLRSGGYGYKSGTSMASPVVAGVAALVFAANENLTADQCKQVLYSTARDLGDTGWDQQFGWGEVDAETAVKEVTTSINGADSLLLGSSSTYTASNSIVDVSSWTWSVESGTGAATINASGVLTGTSAGTVTVRATNPSDAEIFSEKTVTIYSASISGASSVTYGSTSTYDAAVSPSGGSWSWSATAGTGSAAIGSKTGVLTATSTGTVTVRYALDSNSSVYVEKSVTISPAPILSTTVSSIQSSYTYTGNAIAPSPAVSYGGAALKLGDDYTIAYKNSSGSIVASPTDVGTYTLVITGAGNFTGTRSLTFKITTSWNRLWGDTALGTMSEIVDSGFLSTRGTVVLATLDNFPDALTASGIAGLAGAPVLLTDGAALSAETKAKLARLKPDTIIVCGGTSAISYAVASAAKAAANATNLYRCAGASRSGTACAIYENALSYTGSSFGTTAFIATGANFADALSIAPYAYAKHCPIFLTENDGTISSETLSAMKSGGIKSFYILGGTDAVPESAKSVLVSAGFAFSGRLAGDTRYVTSEQIAEFEYSHGMSANEMGVATGDNYKDALTGAALCGKRGAVLVLVNDENRVTITSFITSHIGKIDIGYVFGGTAAVSSATFASLSTS